MLAFATRTLSIKSDQITPTQQSLLSVKFLISDFPQLLPLIADYLVMII